MRGREEGRIRNTCPISGNPLRGLFTMKVFVGLWVVFSCLLGNSPSVGYAQEKSGDAIYIIFDASGSMWQKLPDGTFKIEAAKKVLQDFAKKDFHGYELAFRVYGHRRNGDCRDSELAVPFGTPEHVIPKLLDFMTQVNPTGKTPIHYSLLEALKDFGVREGEIILISDGQETCDDDPCALIKAWKEKEIKINVHVVGLGLDEKSKEAMQCISDAAGTAYYDAHSAPELAESLSKIQEQTFRPAFRIKAVDAAGHDMRVKGTLSQGDKEIFKVSSHSRNLVEAGDYVLAVGVETKNGNLYEPVIREVQIAETGDTTVRVVVSVPPSVKAAFSGKAEEPGHVSSLIHAYQAGKEVFTFRSIDEVYLDEGIYEFRAMPNSENELFVTESFSVGEHKEIVFQMIHTVKVTVKMIASGSGIWFRENYELWQDGKKKHAVHVANGAQVVPGTYDLHLPNDLTPYVKPGLVVTDENEQHFEVTVPVGHVTVVYQKSDGTRDRDDRCFVGRGPEGRGVFKRSGEQHPLTPGIYNVQGWKKKGKYDRATFEIIEGEETEVILKARE